MADVFVSYARSDKALVAPLVAVIEAQGWSVWWDPSIVPGQEFDRQIAVELKAATAVLVVWTPRSVESRWVRGEARDGADRGILVPVRFEGAELPIDVRALHTTEFDDWAGDPHSPPAQEMIRALGALVARPATPRSASGVTGSAPPSIDPARVAICVLPFANMSGDPEQEYFSDGISEDIITDLSKVSALAVTSRNSAFVYKGRHVDVPKLARELRVSHVLEGSVRKAGGRVRINAQLVDAASNDHVWAERYDRDLNDIFALQDEISRSIVKALKLKLLPAEQAAIEQRGTENVEAYNLYLMAWQHYVNSQEKDVQRLEAIVRLCGRATELDPGYARAWALMAIAQMILCFAHGRRDADGLSAAERALALDPDLAEAHAAKARVLARYARYDEAFAEFDIALRLDPDSYDVNRWVAYWKLQQQRPAEAIPYYEKAMAVMETDLLSTAMLGTCYRAIGNARASLRVAEITLARAERRLALDQNDVQALTYGAVALAHLRQAQRAREWMDRALVADPDSQMMRYNFACALSLDSRTTDAAFDMLEPLFATMDRSFLRWATIDPDLAPLRDLPRYRALVAATEARLAAENDRVRPPAP